MVKARLYSGVCRTASAPGTCTVSWAVMPFLYMISIIRRCTIQVPVLDEDSAILTDLTLYSETMGLSLEPETGKAEFI